MKSHEELYRDDPKYRDFHDCMTGKPRFPWRGFIVLAFLALLLYWLGW